MSKPTKGPSNFQVLIFMVFLCVVCATVLSSLATALRPAQEQAEELDRSKQMLMAAKIYHFEGYFLLPDEGGKGYVPAEYDTSTQKLKRAVVRLVRETMHRPGTDPASAAQLDLFYNELYVALTQRQRRAARAGAPPRTTCVVAASKCSPSSAARPLPQ